MLATSTLKGQIVPVAEVQVGCGVPADQLPLPSAVKGNQSSEVFMVLVQPSNFTDEKIRHWSKSQSDSGKAVLLRRFSDFGQGALSNNRLFLPLLLLFLSVAKRPTIYFRPYFCHKSIKIIY